MNLKKLIALVLCVAMLAICPGIGRAAENADASDFQGMDDPQLLRYLEESVYDSLDETLDGSRYIIEDVKAVYISQEYIDEVAFNTRANIYFGYTLSELDDFFDGNRYVFTCGEDGRTAVQEFERYPDNTDAMILKNLAIGTGVILFCVTVSVVSGGVASGAATATAAHTISLVFAASAKTAAEMAAGGALFAAFAPAYATTFSGFYLAIMLVLFGLIVRAVSLEYRAHDPKWGKVWDVLFFIGSLLPALLFGVAIGNVYAGIPLDANGDYAGIPLLGLITLTTLLAFIFTFRKGRIASMRWLQNLAIVSPLFPFLAIEAGWFTAEIGRQPWVVYPATSSPEGVSLLTQASSSASVTSPELAITLALFLLIYLFLIIGWARIVIHLIKVGPHIDEGDEAGIETARKAGNNSNGNVGASIGKAGE